MSFLEYSYIYSVTSVWHNMFFQFIYDAALLVSLVQLRVINYDALNYKYIWDSTLEDTTAKFKCSMVTMSLVTNALCLPGETCLLKSLLYRSNRGLYMLESLDGP